MFQNTSLTLEDVQNADRVEWIVEDLHSVLDDEMVTSYNTNFDFERFLYHEPWNLRHRFMAMEDIMEAASRVPEIERSEWSERKWPKLETAYRYLCPDDPAGIGQQEHRAPSDSLVAGYVLLKLIDMGVYDTPERTWPSASWNCSPESAHRQWL